jgi:hypothetical protein
MKDIANNATSEHQLHLQRDHVIPVDPEVEISVDLEGHLILIFRGQLTIVNSLMSCCR